MRKFNLKTGNELVQFAVCPACDNPIEIVGLYKKLKNTKYPYGSHYAKSIKNLAIYSQQAYDNCPYARKNNKHSRPARKKQFTDFERSIYNLMREQFDRVVYALSKSTDIKITDKSARKMLQTYYNGEGWMYSWATLNNLPWVFGNLTWSKPLYSQPILQNSELQRAISDQCADAMFTESEYYKDYNILQSKSGKYLDINYCLIQHERKITDDRLIETMQLVVSDDGEEQGKEIFVKEIIIDEPYFLNLINLPESRSRRNTRLLEIAAEVMPELE